MFKDNIYTTTDKQRIHEMCPGKNDLVAILLYRSDKCIVIAEVFNNECYTNTIITGWLNGNKVDEQKLNCTSYLDVIGHIIRIVENGGN